MGYNRLGQPDKLGGSPEHGLNPPEYAVAAPPPSTQKKKVILLTLFSIALIMASGISAALLVRLRSRASGKPESAILRKPTMAISRTCSKTRYPDLCVDSLLNFPGSVNASERDLLHISFNMTLQHMSRALYVSFGFSFLQMEPRVRSAYEDCLELLDDSVDALSRSLVSVAPSGAPTASSHDVMTWLSAALTNQETCLEGFAELRGSVKDQLAARLKDLSGLVSNCLAIFAGTDLDDFSGVPVQNRRRLMETEIPVDNEDGLPQWLSPRERKLLDLPISAIHADIVVSKDGNGTCMTIAEAIKKAPENSTRRTIIYVRAGK